MLRNPGILTGWLAVANETADGRVARTATFPRGKDGFATKLGCRALREARVRLATSFDLVGVTSCLPALYLALAATLAGTPRRATWAATALPCQQARQKACRASAM